MECEGLRFTSIQVFLQPVFFQSLVCLPITGHHEPPGMIDRTMYKSVLIQTFVLRPLICGYVAARSTLLSCNFSKCSIFPVFSDKRSYVCRILVHSRNPWSEYARTVVIVISSLPIHHHLKLGLGVQWHPSRTLRFPFLQLCLPRLRGGGHPEPIFSYFILALRRYTISRFE